MNKPRICLITFLFHDAFIQPLSNLESILTKISHLYSIEGSLNELKINNKNIVRYRIIHKQKKNLIFRIIMLFYLQVRMCFRLIKISQSIDLCIIFSEQWEFLLVITAKLLRKKVAWLLPSYLPYMLKYNKSYPRSAKLVIFMQKISFYLSDKIIIHSPNLIKEWNLKKYDKKIVYAHEYYLESDKFKIIDEFKQRQNIIGYVGRLSEEKGIMNFIKAIPIISKYDPNIEFLIIGDGDLKGDIKEFLKKYNLDNVKMKYWIDRKEMPHYLNKLKLLVIPSYTESGPIVALESMACGTPILISKVGHIYTLIKPKKNGFVLKNNSAECIANNVIEILDYNHLDVIAENAYNMVQNEFSYDKTVAKWKGVISALK